MCVLQSGDAQGAGDSDIEETLLVVPVDKRIPLIRMRTRYASQRAQEKFVVAIDTWERDSMFPDGHYMR